MEKRLILTLCVGEAYQEMASISHPRIQAYAEKCGADFYNISERSISETFPHWDKFQIFDLLNKYNRILYIDTDILIREDCPNLFDILPEDKLCMFNEAPYTDRQWCIYEAAKAYDKIVPDWNGAYYNSGVMMIPRSVKSLFKKPEHEFNHYFEQSYLNMKIALDGIEVHGLTHEFNHMSCMDAPTGLERYSSYMMHYAGVSYTSGSVSDLMRADIVRWENDKQNGYKYQRHILIDVQGGLGDQVDAIPTILFAKEKVWPGEDIRIVTHFPRLFEGVVDLPVYLHGEAEKNFDGAFYWKVTLPGPDTQMWSYVSNLLSHTVDFCSMAILRRTLPISEKSVKLEVYPEDISEVIDVIGFDRPISDYVLVHPGRHWQSKCQPLSSLVKIPGGWKQMGDIKEGDVVCTPDGNTANVMGIYLRGEDDVYRITFEDGRQTECTKDHLWKVYHENWEKDKNGNENWKVMSLEDIIDYRNKSKRPMFTPLPNAIYGEEKELPIDPYVIGCLIGDGCFSENQSLQFSSLDKEIIDNLKERLLPGYAINRILGRNGAFTITRKPGSKEDSYRTILKELGLWGKNSHDKFVPEIYKEASIEQRMELLQGLMDTDGYASKNASVAFYSSNKQLALDVQYLVRSLGGVCKINEKVKPNPYNGSDRIQYTCLIRHDHPENFFKLERKKQRAIRIRKNITRKCKIVNIEYIGKEDVQCINIDHPDHLYITNDFIITHNTFPTAWWQGVIDGLVEAGLPVIIIGKNDETRGNVDIEIRDGVKDTRDLLSLGGLIGIISQAKVVVSNDSAPVHIAGAFDNHIIMIPSCKHPDHIFPYRNGSTFYKTASLYKRLTLDDIPSAPTQIYGQSAEFLAGMVEKYPWLEEHQGGWEKSMKNTPEFNADLEQEWAKYLPDTQEVVEKTMEFYSA